MGALSPYSSIFSNTQKELTDLVSQGQLQTKEERGNFVRSKGINLNDFREAQAEYFTLQKQGKQDSLDTPGFTAGRIVGGALGKVGEGIERVGETFAPETTQAIKDKINLPESIERKRQELFFPTQGGPVEEVVTDIASYLVPATGAIKVLNVGSKLLGVANKAGKVGKFGKITAGWAAGTTLVEKPEENLLNQLAEYTVPDEGGKPMGTVGQIVEKLKVNPDDTKSAQYLKSFLNNLAIEGSLGGTVLLTLKGLGKLPAKTLAKKIGGLADEYIIPTAVKDLAKSVNKTRKEWFSSRMGLDDDGLALLSLRSGAPKAAVTRASILEKELRRAIKKEMPRKSRTDETMAGINQALTGDEAVLTNIAKFAPETATAIRKMRGEIDKMSMYIRDNIALGKSARIKKTETVADIANRTGIDEDELLKLNPNLTDINIQTGTIKEVILPSLQTSIDNNLNTYINRTYQIFDDPSYAKKLRKKFNLYREGKLDGDKSKMANDIRNTRDYFKGLKDTHGNPIPDSDIDEIMNYYLEGVTRPEYSSFIKGLGGRTSKILKNRKEVPQEIKALWGEVKDPMKNYANSYVKMANVISEYNFLEDISQMAIKKNKAVFGNIPKGDMIKAVPDEAIGQDLFAKSTQKALGGASGGVKNPLQGLFIDPSWKKAIDDGMEVALGENAVMRHWMKVKATSQGMKTVFSIPTHGRNVMGNLFIMLANGTVNPLYMAKGFGKSMKRFSNLTSAQDLERFARYQELGVIDSSINAASLRAAAGDAFKKGHEGFVEGIVNKTRIGRGGKKIAEKTIQAYEAEDNLFKIANFENLMSSYRKAFPDMTEDALEKFTAQRTRDMMPNYNLVPKAIKSLRALPLGNFVAFPAEMIRNSMNLAKYAWKDISGTTAREMRAQGVTNINEDAIRAMGYKRLAGMTAAGVAGDAMVEQSKQMFGISDEEEEAFNNVLPEWEKGTNKIFTGPLKRNSKGDITVSYLNLGPLDPYAYIKNPAKMIAASLLNNEDYNEQTIQDMQYKAITDMLSPFTDPSMAIQSALDAYTGRGATVDEPTINKIGRVLKDTFTPGTLDYINKRLMADKSEQKFGEGQAKNQYGFSIAKGEVDNLALFGLRRQTANLSEGFKFNTSKPLGDMKKSKRRFKNVIKDYTNTDPNAVVEAYKESQLKKYEHAQRLKTVLRSYRRLGMDEGDMYKALTKEGLLSDQDFEALMMVENNIFIPDALTDDDIALSELETKSPIDYEKLMQLYSDFYGSEID
ncbi:LysM peptidoglycan-binding domain-containing protein [Octadecabacter sp.]|nr:LysM peptidoglycan-binding domain-containing protein [Octadecabacter sp.]